MTRRKNDISGGTGTLIGCIGWLNWLFVGGCEGSIAEIVLSSVRK